MPAQVKNNILLFEGCNYFSHRLILSTLSGKPIKISNIRSTSDDPGLREFEISFVRLLDKITNGSRIEINETGTSLYYSPGLLVGGEVDHDCNVQRDPSVDRIKTSGVPILRKFLIGDSEITFNINKRGVKPLGGGEIYFKCPASKFLKSIQCHDSGKVKRIRGTACSLRVSPAISNRLVESAKGVLLNFIPDIYIHTDARKGVSTGKSPGFGISLTAETTTGVFFTGEAYNPTMTTGSLPCVPEDLGKAAAMKLLDEIHRNGCVDSPFQSLTALFMALGKRDISKMVVGPLTPAMIQFLRDLKDFFGITFKLKTVKDTHDSKGYMNKVSITCLGTGYSNLSKRVL
ncbi:RNA 3'-terminal phosphate cyclase-like protein isoform X2 [Phymastichus coffea]|uniref:RNA 3'-terminal phosphate cyclase-like protein isoform X2 n=1 Tax=Phymastichus coffea TaxID=108790 RepID=UPI00273B76A9|nr:RNA 3'-terminal phosphate cyclase-like protein isoform X2 [Phymastichus coffea]